MNKINEIKKCIDAFEKQDIDEWIDCTENTPKYMCENIRYLFSEIERLERENNTDYWSAIQMENTAKIDVLQSENEKLWAVCEAVKKVAAYEDFSEPLWGEDVCENPIEWNNARLELHEALSSLLEKKKVK